MSGEMQTIETARLTLRPWHESDAAELYSLASDPDVGPAAGWPPHTSVDNSLEIIRTVFSSPDTYAVVLRRCGRPVGCCGLVPEGERPVGEIAPAGVEIGYWLGRDHWGQGIIPEAVNALVERVSARPGVKSLWIAFYTANDKSRRVAEKCGFTYHHTSGGEHFYVKPV